MNDQVDHIIRALFIDDHPEFFRSTVGFPSTFPVRKLEPDLVLMDLRMPGIDGLETICQWPGRPAERHGGLKVVQRSERGK